MINADTLLNYKPDYYKNSEVIKNLDEASADQINALAKKLENIYNQFFLLSEHVYPNFGY